MARAEAAVDRLQGDVQAGGASLGARMLRGIGDIELLPDSMQRGARQAADDLQHYGVTARRDNEREAVAAVREGQSDARAIRDASTVVEHTLETVTVHVTREERARYLAAGEAIDGGLDSTGQLVERGTSYAPALGAAAAGAAGGLLQGVGHARLLQYYGPQYRQLAEGLAPSGKETFERHLMTETVRPSIEARIDRQEDKARELLRTLPPVERDGAHPAVPSASHRAMPKDMRDPDHPGHREYAKSLDDVHRMELRYKVPSGPHSEHLAMSVAIAVEQGKLQVQRLDLGANGQVVAIERGPGPAFDERPTSIDATRVLALTPAQASEQWLHARSPQYSAGAPRQDPVTRGTELDALSPGDRALFTRIREGAMGHISDDVIAHAMVSAKRAGITDAAQVDKVLMSGDSLWVAGRTPGQRAAIDVTATPPALSDTLQDSRALNRDREEQIALQPQRSQDESAPVQRLG